MKSSRCIAFFQGSLCRYSTSARTHPAFVVAFTHGLARTVAKLNMNTNGRGRKEPTRPADGKTAQARDAHVPPVSERGHQCIGSVVDTVQVYTTIWVSQGAEKEFASIVAGSCEAVSV